MYIYLAPLTRIIGNSEVVQGTEPDRAVQSTEVDNYATKYVQGERPAHKPTPRLL